MNCIDPKCDATEIENDDNFCYKCGSFTAKGFAFLQDERNVRKMENGSTSKQNSRLSVLVVLLISSAVVFTAMLLIRGNDLFKPFFYIKKQIQNHQYGYNTTLLKTDNKYNEEINTYDEAIEKIRMDFDSQDLACFNSLDVDILSREIEKNYLLANVSLCDMKEEVVKEIENTIKEFYSLFINIKGSLTNISITNTAEKDDYIARFQPMYQFVNINKDINEVNKVNKTQILLNSYYFLNEELLNKPLEEVSGGNYYVEGSTWYSTIAHELGHYVSFLTLLKKNGIYSIALETKENTSLIKDIINEYTSGNYSRELLEEALNNYNQKYSANKDIYEFASTISTYASSKDNEGNLLAEETIAEAVHDYYLHRDNMKASSREIVNVLKNRL